LSLQSKFCCSERRRLPGCLERPAYSSTVLRRGSCARELARGDHGARCSSRIAGRVNGDIWLELFRFIHISTLGAYGLIGCRVWRRGSAELRLWIHHYGNSTSLVQGPVPFLSRRGILISAQCGRLLEPISA